MQKDHAQLLQQRGLGRVGGVGWGGDFGQPGAQVQARHAFLADGLQMDGGRDGQVLGKALGHGVLQPLPAGMLLEGEGQGMRVGQPQQVQRGRVGLLHAELGIDHQHAFAQVADHQGIDLFLRLGLAAAVLGQVALAPHAACQLVRQIGHREIACAGKAGLVVGLGAFYAASHVLPCHPAQGQQRDAGRGGQGQRQIAQHGRDQDGNGQQGRVVQRPGLQHLQQADDRDVHADHGQPVHAGAGRGRLGACRQPQQQRQPQVAQANQPDQGIAAGLHAEQRQLQQQKRSGDEHAAGQEALP